MKGNKTHENKIVADVNKLASRSRFKGIFNFLYDDESKNKANVNVWCDAANLR